MPEGLKQCEVAPVEREEGDGEDGDGPLIGEAGERRQCRLDGPEHEEEQEQARTPDQRIDQHRNKAAADACQRHLDRHQLRRIDVKLI